MPSKKKRYNARFPPARIKKIMQTDEDVGKVAAAVPVIISRALELFIESLILKANETTQNRHAKTLSTAHIKQTIMVEKEFDFLRDLVANIPDHQTEEEGETTNATDAKKPRVPRQRKYKAESAGPSRRSERKASSDSSHLEVDEEDEETESDEESDHYKNSSAQESDHLGNTSSQENDSYKNTSTHENDRLKHLSGEEGSVGNSSGMENDGLGMPSGEGDSVNSTNRYRNNSFHSPRSSGNGDDGKKYPHPSSINEKFRSPPPSLMNSLRSPSETVTSSPLAASLLRPPVLPGTSFPPEIPSIPQPSICNPSMPGVGFPGIPMSGPPHSFMPGQHPYPMPLFNHRSPVPPGYMPVPVMPQLHMYKPPPSEDDDYDA